MTLDDSKKSSKERVKLCSGASIVRVKPIFTHDSKFLIVASELDIKIFSIQSGECMRTLRHHKSRIISLQENKENSLQFWSCSEDGILVRWDHSEGQVLQVVNLKMSLSCFWVSDEKNKWFVIKAPPSLYTKALDSSDFRLYSIQYKRDNKKKVEAISKFVVPKENAFAIGYKERFIASIEKSALNIYIVKEDRTIIHKTDTKSLTCVCAHPSDNILATGDNYGRVIVWSNLFDLKRVNKAVYHWHALPVLDVAFSCEGEYLYSGGSESVLIKWNLFSDTKSYLPRLGAPISYLKVSPCNTYIATSHIDNSIQIINSQKIIVQVLQGLTQGYFQGSETKDIIPTGLLYHPRLKAVVLNGKPGHLQFYSIHQDKHLFNLDISRRNLISSDLKKKVYNVDIQRAAIDASGTWLATVEYWNDGQTSSQIWLKFWEDDTVNHQTFTLNTDIILPHNKEISCIVFRPYETTEDRTPLAVTSSMDRKFKVWALRPDASIENKSSWTCLSMGCFRDLPAGETSFSRDGSLLAVAFGSSVTLWTIEPTVLKAVLCHDKSDEFVKQVAFGHGAFSHLMVCHNGISITVWNILSLSIEYTVNTKLHRIAYDSYSNRVAAFCEDQTLVIFKPDNPEPIQVVENAFNKPIVAALFVPSPSRDSQLYFFNSLQNLLTLTDEEDDDAGNKAMVHVHQNLPLTPFAALQAETKVSNVPEYEPDIFMNTLMDPKKLDISCPTFMDIHALCSKVLKTSLIPIKKNDEL